MPLTSPLQEGNPNTTNHSLSKIKQHPKTPRPKEGRGCVTPVHSYLKSKTITNV